MNATKHNLYAESTRTTTHSIQVRLDEWRGEKDDISIFVMTTLVTDNADVSMYADAVSHARHVFQPGQGKAYAVRQAIRHFENVVLRYTPQASDEAEPAPNVTGGNEEDEFPW